jgi:hypothetical protein
MSDLGLIAARSASLQLAVLALEYVPMWAAEAHGTDPLDQGRFRLEHGERMRTVTGHSHLDVADL